MTAIHHKINRNVMLKKSIHILFKSFIAILLIAIIYIVCGCYFPKNIKGEKMESILYNMKQDTLTNNENLKLYVFNTGINKVSKLLVGSPNPWRPAPAFVIKHPKFGLIIFDSGLSSETELNTLTSLLFSTISKIDRELPNQMKSIGLNPNEVKKVIFSHMHFDHIGKSDLFTNATIYYGEDTELKSQNRMNGFEPNFISMLQKKHSFIKIKFSSAQKYATFNEAIDLFGDGTIIAIKGNGHQLGSISILINLPNGPVLLTGDEVVHFDWLNSDDIQYLAVNKNIAANFRNQVRKLIELIPSIIIFPGHDFPKMSKKRNDIIVNNPDYFNNSSWVKPNDK